MTLVSTIESCPPRKRVLARLIARTPLTRAAAALERRRPILRIVNYHGTPERARASLAAQIDHLLLRYAALDPWRLEAAFSDGVTGRPRILFTFDDGLAVHRTVAAEVLEQRGVRAIFCVPSAFPSIPVEAQREWFIQHVYPAPTELHAEIADTQALSWGDARDLVARGHRICSHTSTHAILSAGASPAQLRDEIERSRSELEARLDAPVDGFCWPRLFDPRATAADASVRRTFAWALTTRAQTIRRGHDPYRLGRINLEASWPTDVVDLQLSGVAELWQVGRRLLGAHRG